MNTSPVFSKKPSVCRYFSSNGQCFYGDSCQFTHLRTDERKDEPNNGDAFFNATFKNLQTHFDKSEYSPSEVIQRDDEILSNLNGLMLTESPPAMQSSFLTHFKQEKEPPVQNGINPAAVEFVPIANSPAAKSAAAAAAAAANRSNGFGGNSSDQSGTDSSSNTSRQSTTTTTSDSYGLQTYKKSSSQARKESKSPIVPMQDTVGGSTYFYSSLEQNKDHHSVVTSNLTTQRVEFAHLVHTELKRDSPPTLTYNHLKAEILTRQAIVAAGPAYLHSDIPTEIDSYVCICPLESKELSTEKSTTFGYVTSLYKATNSNDSLHYCLRRIHGFRLGNTKCMPLIDTWKKVSHSNIVNLFEVFTTRAFGDHSIVFVYEFFPHSFTVLEHYFGSIPNAECLRVPFQKNQSMSAPFKKFPEGIALLPENIIWTYAVQLSSALRVMHAHHLACRVLDPSKILVTSKSRLRVNCVGIFDCLANSTGSSSMINNYQQDDLLCLGKLLMAFACNSVKAMKRENMHTSMQIVAQHYSVDLKNLIIYLTSSQSRNRCINDIMPMIGARFYVQLDGWQTRFDSLENQLSMEIENGRLFRLVSKLGAINERPEYGNDAAWSDTGDRYILKLFRDYLFHQVDSSGKPWFDMAHIVMNLNKLDAGIQEKICLMSRDEQSIIMVSYAELKRCVDISFNELIPLTS